MWAKFKGIFSYTTTFLVVVLCIFVSSSHASDDQTFAQLKKAAFSSSPHADGLANQLSQYPIPSYVDYYRLKAHLKTADESEVIAFINKYDGSAIADRLRNDWLLLLGQREDWEQFDRYYPQFELDDDVQVKCYALISAANKNQDVVQGARHLLTQPKKYGIACPALITKLYEQKQFSDKDIWFQARLISHFNQNNLAARIASLTGASSGDVLRAINRPSSILSSGPGYSDTEHALFLFAISRLAKKEWEQALSILQDASSQLSQDEIRTGYSLIALPASIALAPEALSLWKNAQGATLSPFMHEWRVRSALRQEDWTSVHRWIEEMPISLQNKPEWIYWKGRACLAFDDSSSANTLFFSIKNQFNFYGQLATEELGEKIVAPSKPDAFSEDDVQKIAQNEGIQRALKFFDMNWRFEAQREWNWQLRRMNETQLLAAAEYARRQKLLDRMVFTSNKTTTLIDFSQRFPTPFYDIVQEKANALNLDIAWTYGLIRQESRFVMNARSAVGASGLMQVMPATAKQVARRIGLRNYRKSGINGIETNIILGTNYLSMMLHSLENSFVLASAGYNAGPNRPKAWRSKLASPIEGGIFAETIPFTETRDYVKKVLSNTVYYAALLSGKSQSLKARLGVIYPPNESN